MKEFKDIFPKTNFAMDALITAVIEETENLDQEHRKALFETAISGVAMLAGTAMNGNYGHGTFCLEDAEEGHRLLMASAQGFLPTAVKMAEEEMEDTK